MKSKKCSGCGDLKVMDNFYKSKTQAGGYQANCKDCNRIVAKKWYQSADKVKTRLSSRRTLLKCKYNISSEEYRAMLKKQKGVCAICKKPETQISNTKGGVDSLRVDHCHKTGKVRGLLCSRCNFAIGHIKDSVSRAVAIAGYLLKHL